MSKQIDQEFIKSIKTKKILDKLGEKIKEGDIDFAELRSDLKLNQITALLKSEQSISYDNLVLLNAYLHSVQEFVRDKIISYKVENPNKANELPEVQELEELQDLLIRLSKDAMNLQKAYFTAPISSILVSVKSHMIEPIMGSLLELDMNIDKLNNTKEIVKLRLLLNDLIVSFYEKIKELSAKDPNQIDNFSQKSNKLLLEAIVKLKDMTEGLVIKCNEKQKQLKSRATETSEYTTTTEFSTTGLDITAQPVAKKAHLAEEQFPFKKAMAETSNLMGHIFNSDAEKIDQSILLIMNYLNQIHDEHEFAGLIQYLSSIQLDETDKRSAAIQSQIAYLIENCENRIQILKVPGSTIQEPLVQRFKSVVQASIRDFTTLDSQDPLLKTIEKYNPENNTINDIKMAREIAKAIGLHDRLAKLKRKIYKAQILGSSEKADKFGKKVDQYLRIMQREREKIDPANTKLIGVFDAEIIFAKNLILESKKAPTSALKVKRINSLFTKNPQRKKSEAIAASIESLHQENAELYNNAEKAPLIRGDDAIRDLFREKMRELYAKYPKLYKEFSLAFAYETQSHSTTLKRSQQKLAEKLPALTAEVIDKLQLIHTNVDVNSLEAALQLYNPISSIKDRESEHNLVGHLQRYITKNHTNLTRTSVKDIMRSTPESLNSRDQESLNSELSLMVKENLKLNKVKIDKYLEEYAKLPKEDKRNIFQKIKAEKLEKKITKLLGLRQFNELLKREIILNIALSDKDGNLAHLGTMANQFRNAIKSVIKTIPIDSNTSSLTQILTEEAKTAKQMSEHIRLTLPKMTFGAKTVARVVSLVRAKKAAEYIKHHPRDWTEGNPPKGTIPKKKDGSSTPPPPAKAA